jgi:diguanylate cyclase (GGDEF)-like protein
MDKEEPSIYVRVGGWTLTAALVVCVALDAWMRRTSLMPALADTLVLGAGAATAAWLAGRGGALRVALTFILAAFVLLPPPGAALVTLAACAPGLGAGVAGLDRRGGGAIAALVVPVTAAHLLYAALPSPPNPASSAALFHICLLFALVQTCATALGKVVDEAYGFADPKAAIEPRLLLEALNAPLAWLVVSWTVTSGPLRTLLLSGLVLGAQLNLRELARARSRLRETHDALTARVTELATLHAIGREILSSFEPSRVFAIVDRECRKILELDSLLIALVDRETRQLHAAYSRHRGEEPDRSLPPLGQGLASWVVHEKRAVRIDDLRDDRAVVPRPPELLDPEARSIMAVPLIVEDEAIGVVTVQSSRPAAYDDHLLSVLTTIAQQAAVAIENARHYEMATVDSLTGLFLRPYFFRRLEEEYNRSKRYHGSFGLLMMDLDGFKAINDRYGHLVGDRYLRSFGGIVQSRLRGPDLACRYGGDEVCLLLPETDLSGAKAIAERIRSAVGSLVVHVDTLAVRTTTSIGVAAFPDHDTDDLKGLLRKADEALYTAKKCGRDRVVPVPSAA